MSIKLRVFKAARETRATDRFFKLTIKSKIVCFIVIIILVFRIKINFTVARISPATDKTF
jgi:hypothetical protein